MKFSTNRKQTFARIAVFSVLALGLFATGTRAEEIDRSHQWGIGTNNLSGIGARHWTSNRFAWDGNVSGSYQDSNSSTVRGFGLGIGPVMVLAQKDYARLMFLPGVLYQYSKQNTTPAIGPEHSDTTKTTSFNLGFGAEYSFQELPNLAFGLSFNGLGLSYREDSYDNVTSNGHHFTHVLGISTATTTLLTTKYYF